MSLQTTAAVAPSRLRDGLDAPAGARAVDSKWSLAVAIVLAFFVLRVMYLFWFSRWELVGDEAHYWEWSRRPDLSYYTKGPGIAWVIWLSTRVFGDVAGAVRLPSAIASAVMALFGARLAHELTGGRRGAGWCTALTLCLTPAYVATAQLATTDVFYSAAWMAAAWCVWRAVRPEMSATQRLRFWTAAGGAIGVGCLFKYTALLELVGIAGFLLGQRRRVRLNPATIGGIALALVALVAVCSPMLIWNARQGWPTIAHQIGRLRLPGGDESVAWNWSPLWLPEFAGAQIALLGGVGVALIAMSIRRSRTIDGTFALGRSLLVWLAIPILAIYLGLSVFRETQGNWAIAAYTTLLVLVGIDAADAIGELPRPQFRSLWHWFLGVGAVVTAVLLTGPALIQSPPLANLHAVQRLDARVSGASVRAASTARVIADVAAQTGRAPFVVTKTYQEASLLAFYLPGHPRVLCAASAMGARPNAYDYFADTDLSDARRLGHDAVLVGGTADRWRDVLRFDSIEPAATAASTFVGRNYRGLVDRGRADRSLP